VNVVMGALHGRVEVGTDLPLTLTWRKERLMSWMGGVWVSYGSVGCPSIVFLEYALLFSLPFLECVVLLY
jgi:hypothetical protein